MEASSRLLPSPIPSADTSPVHQSHINSSLPPSHSQSYEVENGMDYETDEYETEIGEEMEIGEEGEKDDMEENIGVKDRVERGIEGVKKDPKNKIKNTKAEHVCKTEVEGVIQEEQIDEPEGKRDLEKTERNINLTKDIDVESKNGEMSECEGSPEETKKSTCNEGVNLSECNVGEKTERDTNLKKDKDGTEESKKSTCEEGVNLSECDGREKTERDIDIESNKGEMGECKDGTEESKKSTCEEGVNLSECDGREKTERDIDIESNKGEMGECKDGTEESKKSTCDEGVNPCECDANRKDDFVIPYICKFNKSLLRKKIRRGKSMLGRTKDCIRNSVHKIRRCVTFWKKEQKQD